MTSSRCGHLRDRSIGVAAKRSHCDLGVMLALAGGNYRRWLARRSGQRILAIVHRSGSSKGLGMVFGYAYPRVKGRTVRWCRRYPIVRNGNLNHSLYGSYLRANPTGPDSATHNLAFRATRATSCGCTKSDATSAAPCFVIRETRGVWLGNTQRSVNMQGALTSASDSVTAVSLPCTTSPSARILGNDLIGRFWEQN